MPNIIAVLNDQIRRLAKREITANTKVVRKATVEYRHAIAALKRQVADLTKRLAVVEKQAPKEVPVPTEVLEKGRFRAIGVKAHRAKLGLSAKDYGKLAGVAPITIYQWESGKSEPRKAQKARWLAIRGLGKREALQRLGLAEPAPAPAAKPAPRQTSKRGTFKQTGKELVLSLLKGRRVLTTSQLGAA
ncbi:MAG: helix-turn-helix domain-containing protein, partial [Phycisphaerae bacterium]